MINNFENKKYKIQQALSTLRNTYIPDILLRAGEGDPAAQYSMGCISYVIEERFRYLIYDMRPETDDTHKDSLGWYQKSLKGYAELAGSGDVKARLHLAELYRLGKPGVVGKDPLKSANYFKGAVSHGGSEDLVGMFLACSEAIHQFTCDPNYVKDDKALLKIAEQMGLCPKRNDAPLPARQNQGQSLEST